MEEEEKNKEEEGIENESEEMEKKKKDVGRQNEKQIKKMLVIGAGIFLIFFLILFFINESKTFNYGGIKFKKEKFDQLDLYTSVLPRINLVGNVIGEEIIYLRNDPRELDYILINTTIKLKRNMIFSVSPEANKCPYGAVAVHPLNNFLHLSNVLFDIGSTDEDYAEEKKIPHITCKDVGNELYVLILQKGNSTIIREEKPGCYILEFSECGEMSKVMERFIVGAISHSSGREI